MHKLREQEPNLKNLFLEPESMNANSNSDNNKFSGVDFDEARRVRLLRFASKENRSNNNDNNT